MDKPKTTPKDFFLWAGAMVAFYWSILAFVFLVFTYIEYAFPNAFTAYPLNPYDSGISTQMASIIVLVPLYLILVRVITKGAERDPSRAEIWVRRWALIFTLFLAGVAMAGDLIVLLTSFLSGEALTTAFLLKVLLVLLVAAGVFMHFIADLKGYWSEYPVRRRYVSAGVAVIALGSIVAGFFIVGTPQEARRERYDAQRVTDLQILQSQVVSYWDAKRELPKDLALVAKQSTDPETHEPYRYEATGKLTFKLCATFNAASRAAMSAVSEPYMYPMQGGVSEDWTHGAGEVCFDRTIDPSFFQKYVQ